jgi:anthranilate phosphoribosyltransferase
MAAQKDDLPAGLDVAAARRWLRQHLGDEKVEICDEAILNSAAAIVLGRADKRMRQGAERMRRRL